MITINETYIQTVRECGKSTEETLQIVLPYQSSLNEMECEGFLFVIRMLLEVDNTLIVLVVELDSFQLK